MPHGDRDRGFTLIEVIVVLALLGVMMAIAVSGWSSWAKASAHRGTAQEIQTVLRQVQQRAVTEGRAMCVWFDVSANTYTAYRGACDGGLTDKVAGPYATARPDVRLASPSFTGPTGPGVTFYARGTASPGQVSVTRDDSTKQFQVRVEGLTGRVSLH